MEGRKLLQRLYLLKKNPSLYKELTNEELADFVRVVLMQVESIEKAIQSGIHDGYTPQPGKDYLSRREMEDLIKGVLTQALDAFQRDLTNERSSIDQAVKKRLSELQHGKNGKDALITPEIVADIARKTVELIELPNFEALITQEPTAIRDALELLQGDERLDISAIKGLSEVAEELRQEIRRTPAGGVSRNTVQAMIDASPVGSGDMLAATYDPQGIEADAFDVDNHTDGTTNKVYSATDKTKLAGIEALADVTDAANVDAAGAVMNSDTSTASMQFVIDEDSMATNSATKVPTQQSVKAYVDAQVVGGGGISEELAIAYSVAL